MKKLTQSIIYCCLIIAAFTSCNKENIGPSNFTGNSAHSKEYIIDSLSWHSSGNNMLVIEILSKVGQDSFAITVPTKTSIQTPVKIYLRLKDSGTWEKLAGGSILFPILNSPIFYSLVKIPDRSLYRIIVYAKQNAVADTSRKVSLRVIIYK